MIAKTQIIEFIELNPSITKNTSIATLNDIHKQIFNKPIADKSCGSCVMTALNKIRSEHGYEVTTRREHKSIVKERLNECYTCEHLVKNGLFGFVDQCGICKCSVRAKAELRPRLLNILGGCPENKWKV
jgi:hypothetical protein